MLSWSTFAWLAAGLTFIELHGTSMVVRSINGGLVECSLIEYVITAELFGRFFVNLIRKEVR